MQIVGTKELFEALDVEVPASQIMRDSIDLWTMMYRNKSPWLKDDTQSLNFAAIIASELANLTVNEMELDIDGSARAKYLDQYAKLILLNISEKMELGCAVGDIVLLPYVKNVRTKQLGINYVKAGDHWPLEFGDDGQSTAELFLDRKTIGKQRFIRGEVQRFYDDVLEIENKVVVTNIDGSGASLDRYRPARLEDVEDWKDLPEFDRYSNVKQPPWGLFKVPLANNVDPSSPMGISCFSRAVDSIRWGDEQVTRLLNEYDLGQFAVMADETMFKRDRYGNFLLPNKRLFIPMNTGDKKPFEEWAPTIRDSNYIAGLNEIKSIIEFQVSFAKGTWSDEDDGQVLTATAVNLHKHRTYTTVKKARESLKNAVTRAVGGLNMWASEYSLAPPGEYEISFAFDESIDANLPQERAKAQQWVNMGWMSPVRYFVMYEGFSKEEAEEIYAEAQKDSDNEFEKKYPQE